MNEVYPVAHVAAELQTVLMTWLKVFPVGTQPVLSRSLSCFATTDTANLRRSPKTPQVITEHKQAGLKCAASRRSAPCSGEPASTKQGLDNPPKPHLPAGPCLIADRSKLWRQPVQKSPGLRIWLPRALPDGKASRGLPIPRPLLAKQRIQHAYRCADAIVIDG